MVNILCQAAKIEFIDNTNVTNRMLNNSKLYPNPVGRKVAVNNIWKLTSQWLTQLCEVEKWSKEENISNSNSSCSKDLAIRNPGRPSFSRKDKSSNAFPKLRELRLKNPINNVIRHLNIKSEINLLYWKNWSVATLIFVCIQKLKLDENFSK